jgi:hypothetical protein
MLGEMSRRAAAPAKPPISATLAKPRIAKAIHFSSDCEAIPDSLYGKI